MTFLCPQDDCQPIVGEQKPPILVISVIIEGNGMSKYYILNFCSVKEPGSFTFDGNSFKTQLLIDLDG